MTGEQYIVVEETNGWAVRYGSSAIANTPSMDDALCVAKVLAYAVKAVGGHAKVFVQNEAGSLITYDLDGA